MPLWRPWLRRPALSPVASPAADPAASPVAPAIRAAQCRNCGQAYASVGQRYCGHCGQESRLRPPRVFEFLQQLGGAYFSTEGALWRTLGLLLTRPGELTRRYLAGRRKHYVLPLRLYITISLLVLLLLRLNLSSDLKLASELDANLTKKPTINILDLGDGARAGVKDGQFFCRELPDWVCRRLEAKFDVDPKSFARDLKLLPERFINHWGTAMFLLVPVFALLHKLVYFGRRLYYTEHLIYALHVHSFWFAAAAVALLPWSGFAPAMAFLVPVYTFAAARRVYGGSWIGTVLRGSLVALLYGIVLSLALAVVGVWAFFS